jgi:dTDP-4-dehydrorhamnose 3,5-epimerase
VKNGVVFLEGGMAVDDRGQLQFCNSFDLKTMRRFYIVSNHAPQFVRAWHGHKKETKYIFIASGSAIVAAVKINNWSNPDKKAKVYRFVLSEKKPGLLKIPAGYAHGIKTLSEGTKIIVFTNLTLEDSLHDDYRYEATYWNPWNIESR